MLYTLPLLFACADRLIGWGGFGRVKPMIATTILAGAIGYATLGWPFAFLGLLWCGWRSLPFFDGSLAPEDFSERVACFARNLLLLPIAALAWKDWWQLELFLFITACAITAMRYLYGYFVSRGQGANLNVWIELFGGFLFGTSITLFGLLHA